MPDLSAGMVSKQQLSRLKGQLPAPVQGVLHATGLNVVDAAPHEGANHLSAIASVDPDSVNTIAVSDPHRFVGDGAETLGHEATHLWQQNLPPTVAAKIPAGDPSNPYAFSEADLPKMRAAGKTLASVPREVGPSIIQHYIANGGANAPAALQKIYDPWVKDLQTTPLSTIIPTQPGQVSNIINTTPRPPLPQF